jgi:F420-0:gamma-glutamyl ligase
MIREGDDLVSLILDAIVEAGEKLANSDLVIVTSKVVSKSEKNTRCR